MNDITVSSMIVAEASREQVWLKSLLGAYEINFNFTLRGSVERDGKKRWININSARVSVKTDKSQEIDLGLAHLEVPLSLQTHPGSPIYEQITFHLLLNSVQLSRLEEARDGSDLYFQIKTKGIGGDGTHKNAEQNEWKIKIPRSDWIEKLKQAGYMDVLLLEVPIPLKDTPDEWLDIRQDLEEAQRHFMNREYASCVAKCRNVVQETGHKKFGKKNWSDPLLDKIGKKAIRGQNGEKNRTDMSKDEREGAIWAALRHYTHQAHHSVGEGGERIYDRSEARLALVLASAFVGN